MISKDDKSDVISKAYPIAGELKEKGGKYSEVKWTRLKTSKLDTDAGKEGVRLEIKGGFKNVDQKTKDQKAFVEFICDHSLVGTENPYIPEDQYQPGEKSKRDEEAKSDELTLNFVSYDTSGENEDVLNLLWKTQYACEDTKRNEDAENKNRWGFFTWFIIMYATYPISVALAKMSY